MKSALSGRLVQVIAGLSLHLLPLLLCCLAIQQRSSGATTLLSDPTLNSSRGGRTRRRADQLKPRGFSSGSGSPHHVAPRSHHRSEASLPLSQLWLRLCRLSRRIPVPRFRRRAHHVLPPRDERSARRILSVSFPSSHRIATDQLNRPHLCPIR